MAAPVVDLTAARASLPPSALLAHISEQCVELGVASNDVYGDFGASSTSSWLRRFELEVAQECGKADALFLPSGTMAQSIALCVHRERARAAAGHAAVDPDAFAAHWTSHLFLHEQGGYAHLLGMRRLLAAEADPSRPFQEPLRLADVERLLLPSGAAPSTLLLEMPHREVGGKCTPWDEVEGISRLCRERGVALHMDGARLWEASGGYAGKTYAELCAPFASVYVSFYKGLGGITGAMLLGDADFIAEARVWLRRFGGNLYSVLPYAVSAWAGYRENKSAFVARRDRLREVVAALTPVVAPAVVFDPPVPEASLVHVYLSCDVATALAARDAARESTGICCFSRPVRPARFQHGGTTVDAAAGAASSSSSSSWCYFEFNLGPLNGAVPDAEWVRGWAALVEELGRRTAATTRG
jgi:threonine aldolase